MEFTCKQCGKVFIAPSGQKDRKYCSVECHKKSRKKPGTKCVCCGKIFRPNYKGQKCCCHRCAGALRALKCKEKPKQAKQRVCLQCGERFTPPIGTRVNFCSRECKSVHLRKCAGAAPEWKKERACINCGKMFMPKREEHKYCTKECQYGSMERSNVPLRDGQAWPMVRVQITKPLPVFPELAPKVGEEFLAEDHRVAGCSFVIIPDICGKRIVVRAGEFRVVEENGVGA